MQNEQKYICQHYCGSNNTHFKIIMETICICTALLLQQYLWQHYHKANSYASIIIGTVICQHYYGKRAYPSIIVIPVHMPALSCEQHLCQLYHGNNTLLCQHHCRIIYASFYLGTIYPPALMEKP